MEHRYYQPEIERLSEAEVRELQLRLLREQLEWASSGSRFYRDRFADSRFRPEQLESLDDIRRLPFIRKEDILADIETEPPYGTRLQVPTCEIVNVVETSGTSGRGKEVQAMTREDLDRIIAAEAFGFVWAGAGHGSVVAINLPVTMAAAGYWWMVTLDRLSCNVLRLASLSAEDRLSYIQRYGVEILVTNSTYLRRLHYVAQELGIDPARDLPRLRSIFAGGSNWSVEWAEEQAEFWHSTLYNQYGTSQRGLAWTCELGMVHESRRGVIHNPSHLCLIEVIDRNSGEHVAPGEEGEVVLTLLNQKATPLIRYATNDKARFVRGRDCPCGRAFDGIQAGSVDRYDDMVKIKGLNVWPQTVDRVVFRYPEVREYRGEVFVDERGREVARVAVDFAPTSGDARARVTEAVGRDLLAEIGLNFEIVEWDGDALSGAAPLGSSETKIRRWIDRR